MERSDGCVLAGDRRLRGWANAFNGAIKKIVVRLTD
jgi:hypothetical protein